MAIEEAQQDTCSSSFKMNRMGSPQDTLRQKSAYSVGLNGNDRNLYQTFRLVE